MDTKFVIVRFPRRHGYYRVAINKATDSAIRRLKINRNGYYDLITMCDEEILWKHATFAAEGLKALGALQGHLQIQGVKTPVKR